MNKRPYALDANPARITLSQLMIRLHTTGNGSHEERAAEKIAAHAATALPELQSSPQISLEVFPSVKCYGQKIQDIDLVLFYFDSRVTGHLTNSTGLHIQSLCVTIEVKTQRAEEIEFEGPACFVYYNGERHDVTHQSDGQKYSLKGYLEKNRAGQKAPYIYNLIWLTECPSAALPRCDSNIIGADASWADILNKIALLARRPPSIDSFSSSESKFRECASVFSKKIQPSHIDRRRMEAITKGVLDRENQNYAKKIGEQLLIFRGRGGTGKTVRLLRIAYQLYKEDGSRVILLTYNNALVADIKRLLQLLDVKNPIGSAGVTIRTIHSFMYEWLSNLGAYNKQAGDFLPNYARHKEDALAMIKGGTITEEDITLAKVRASRSLSWDNVLIDESQDWPEDERDILYRLYGFKRIIIADGVDQFVRSTDTINWKEPIISRDDSQTVTLRRSLRLKSALCKAVSHIAEIIDYRGWDLLPQDDAHGGRVIVIEGNILQPSFHSELYQISVKDGNEPIDVLFCVPPDWVIRSEEHASSRVAAWCGQNGYEVWDGVDTEERQDVPTSLKQFRVVQYDSCRGLEGWTVVACAIDAFYEYKLNTAQLSDEITQDLYFDHDAATSNFAKKWLMIPMTRAIDTLVLHVSNPDSFIGKSLRQLHAQHPDAVTWRKI